MKASDLLITYKEYSATPHPRPYVYTLSKNNQHLYYFGSRHSFDIKDQEFNEIKSLWIKFLEVTEKSNDIVLYEGGGGAYPIYKTIEKAVIDHGERGFITHLAYQVSIKAFSPEPSDFLIIKELEKKFTKEEIASQSFITMSWQWNITNREVKFHDYIQGTLKTLKKESGWDHFDFSLSYMQKIYETMFKRKFDENDGNFFYSLVNPTTPSLSIINQVSADEGDIRDKYIINQIEELWKKGLNVFLIFGESHALRQEKAIKFIVTSD